MFPFRAICIDLEIDACGNTKDEAWENLKCSLIMYFNMWKKIAGGSSIEALENFFDTTFLLSKQKEDYFNLYKQNSFDRSAKTKVMSIYKVLVAGEKLSEMSEKNKHIKSKITYTYTVKDFILKDEPRASTRPYSIRPAARAASTGRLVKLKNNAKKPAAKKPVAKKPAAKKPVTKKLSAKKTVVKKPAAKKRS